MKLFKKLFMACLVFVTAFCLFACGNGDVDELNKKLEEVQAQLDAANAAKDQLEAGKADAEAAKNAAEEALKQLQEKYNEAYNQTVIKEFILDAVEKGLVELKTSKFEIKNDFGAADADDAHHVKVGSVVKLEIEALNEAAGVEFDTPLFSFSYVWANTGDDNGGVKYDENAGTIEFKLPGYYYVDFVAKGTTVPEGEEEPTNITVSYLFLVKYAAQLVTSKDATALDLMVGQKDQLKAFTQEEGVTYALSDFASDNEAVATVSATGEVEAKGEGQAVISAVAKAEGKEDENVQIVVNVTPFVEADKLAGGAEGAYYDFKYTTLDQKAKILATLERYLMNEGASIPVVNNSGLVVYSDRVQFLSDTYVAQMGYGPTSVAPTTGKGAGTDADPAYRMWTSADPSTLNHLNYADSIESDFLSLLGGSLINMEWTTDENGKGNGWEVVPAMSAIPYGVEEKDGQWVAVDTTENGKLTLAKSWKFDLRQDLKWETGEAINADDFIYTYQQVLDPKLNMKRANYYYGGSTPIEGAKAYFEGENTDWASVGIKKVDDYSFVVTFTQEFMEWDVVYSWASFLYSPVHKATWEKCLSADGTSTNYGTSMETYVACGAFKLSYWEKGKEYRFTKNDQYFGWNTADETVKVKVGGYENYSYTIVKDSNAALELFKEGKLDVTSIPAAAYEDFKDDPRVKASPGATSFRFSVNTATQAELDAQYGKGAWEAKPILQEEDFRWALYFGLDRKNVQEITKTSTGWDSYFTNAYSLVASTKNGIEISTYRDTEWAKKVYSGIFENDLPLDNELNYAPTVATLMYQSAVKNMIEKGVIELGTEENPTKITIEIAAFDGTTWEGVLAFVCAEYNKLFNDTEAYGKKVVFEAVAAPQPGMDVYYVKQMTGQFDLALAGISGGTLDPMGFMECFCDDNRSGLFLNPGLDTHNANILIDLDVDGDGVNDGAKYWSFDALYKAYNGKAFIQNGKEAVAPEAAE